MTLIPRFLVHARTAVPSSKPGPTASDNPFAGQAHRRILITGGTGFIGKTTVRHMLDVGHAVTILSRNPLRAARAFEGRARAVGSLEELSADDIFDGVINLAGAPVVGPPWTASRRATLVASRMGTTEALMTWLHRARHKPAVWIQASAIGAYGVRAPDESLDENSATGTAFMSRLCLDWEAAAKPALDMGVRQVVLRFGLVFGRGGALPPMLLPYRLGLGATLGDGKQVMSWIHHDDVIRLIAYALDHESMRGIYNAVAPEAVAQSAFAKTVADTLKRPLFLRLPAAPLRMLTGEMGQLFLDGQRVVPMRLIQHGFTFRFPTLAAAISNLT